MNLPDTNRPDGSCSGPQRDRRNHRTVQLWALAWACSFVAASLGIAESLPRGTTVAGVLLTTALGFATLFAYRRFLRDTDELRRKIEVDALALAFGVGVVVGLAYWLLVESGVAPAIGYAYVFAGMLLTYSLGVHLGRRRYS